MTRIAEILIHSRETFISDAVGVIALAMFTYGLLYLPGLI